MRAPSRESLTDVSFDSALTPMIDVVFQLLIFFLWTANFMPEERALASRLSPPVAGRGSGRVALEEEDFQKMVLRLDAKPDQVVWSLNGRTLGSAEEFQTQLRDLQKIRTDLPLLIDPTPQVPMGSVIDAYDRAQEVGWRNVQFTTRPVSD